METKRCDICYKKCNKKKMRKVMLAKSQPPYYVCRECINDARKKKKKEQGGSLASNDVSPGI